MSESKDVEFLEPESLLNSSSLFCRFLSVAVCISIETMTLPIGLPRGGPSAVSRLVFMAAVVACVMSAEGGLLIQYDSGFTRLFNCPFWAANYTTQCKRDDYNTSLLLWALPNIIGACFVAVVAFGYLISRFAFDCCGGASTAPNFCWPNRQLTSRYSKGDLWRPVLYALVGFVLCFWFTVKGCSNASKLHTDIKSLQQIASDTTSTLRRIPSLLQSHLETVEYFSSEQNALVDTSLLAAASDLASWTTSAEDVRSVIQEMKSFTIDSMASFSGGYLWASYVLIILSLALSVATLLVAALHCTNQPPITLFVMTCVVATLVWAYSGYAIASHHLIHDSCQEVTYFSSRQVNVLSAVTKCTESEGLLTQFSSTYLSLVGVFATDTCEWLISECQKSTVDCPTWESDDCSSVTRYELLSTLAVTSASATLVSRELSTRRTALDSLLANYTVAVGRVSTCNAILSTAAPPLLPSCVLAVEHSGKLATSCCWVGTALIVILFALGMGSKRFLALSRAYAAVLPSEDDKEPPTRRPRGGHS